MIILERWAIATTSTKWLKRHHTWPKFNHFATTLVSSKFLTQPIIGQIPLLSMPAMPHLNISWTSNPTVLFAYILYDCLLTATTQWRVCMCGVRDAPTVATWSTWGNGWRQTSSVPQGVDISVNTHSTCPGWLSEAETERCWPRRLVVNGGLW